MTGRRDATTATPREPTAAERRRASSFRKRGFHDLAGELDAARIRLSSEDDFSGEETIRGRPCDPWRLQPVVEVPGIDPVALAETGIDPSFLSLIVVVEDPTLKSSVVAARHPVSTSVRRVAVDDAASLSAWRPEAKVHVAVVLAAQMEPMAGRAWRKGTWLARKSFTIGEVVDVQRPRQAVREQGGVVAYPVLLEGDAKRLVDSGLTGGALREAAREATHFRGHGPMIDTSIVTGLAADLRALRQAPADRSSRRAERWDEFEISACRVVHERLSPFDRHVLGDLGFWSWLAVAELNEIVFWRYADTTGEAFDGKNFGIGDPEENLIYRLWLQGEIGHTPGTDNPYELAEVTGRDLWRSQIFRRNYDACRSVARAFLRLQSGRLAPYRRLDRDASRKLAKDLNELRKDTFFELLADEEADRLVANLAEPMPHGGRD